MKILIVEDEFISRTVLTEMLSEFGVCHVATNGREAIEAIEYSFDNAPYDLVCLDIMLPEMDGQEVLGAIRQLERDRSIEEGEAIKVVMTTALDDAGNIMKAFTEGQCEAYLTKPIEKAKLLEQIEELGLIVNKD